jgi:hypothetical protein
MLIYESLHFTVQSDVLQFKYSVIINDCPIAVGVKNPHKFWMCRQPRNDTSLTHVMRLAAHSTTSPTPNAMGQSFIMTLYFLMPRNDILFCFFFFY